MASAKPGSRWRSRVCDTEVVVVKGPGSDVDLRCGGASMAPFDEEVVVSSVPGPGVDGGTALGKRYVDGRATLEVLCTKTGHGSLALGDELLTVKSTKPLPSSD